MKVVSLLGSPRRKGNSSTLADFFTSLLQAKGAEVSTYHLNGLTYKGCQACFACKTRLEHCIGEDDLKPVLQKVADSDLLVLASPVYFGEVSAQLKAFIDRTFSFLRPDYATNKEVKTRLQPGKHLVFILVQGHPKEKLFADIYPRYSYFFNWLGFTHSHLLRVCGPYAKGDIESYPEIFDQAKELANKLLP
ncbi:MAG: hypothetical protein PWR24_1264 [Desulfonauticus sp.]|jgi:multimeric flavodoxin WrbA|nr:hypothetical protein [Desulfonauticus sp.]